ncbi:hypothetical protein ACQ4PT_034507 [Festuca glaucescens]
MVNNSVPTMQNYVNDVLPLCLAEQQSSIEAPIPSVNEDVTEEELHLVFSKKYVLQMFNQKIHVLDFHKDTRNRSTISQDEVNDYLKNLYSLGKLNDSDDALSIRDLVQDLSRNLSNKCIVNDSDNLLSLEKYDHIEQSMIPQVMQLPYDPLENSISFTEFMDSVIQDSIELGRQNWFSDNKELLSQKFCLTKMDFCRLGEEPEDLDLAFKHNHMFLYSNHRTPKNG